MKDSIKEFCIKNKLFILLLVIALLPLFNILFCKFLFFLMSGPGGVTSVDSFGYWLHANYYQSIIQLSFFTNHLLKLDIAVAVVAVLCAILKKITIRKLLIVWVVSLISWYLANVIWVFMF